MSIRSGLLKLDWTESCRCSSTNQIHSSRLTVYSLKCQEYSCNYYNPSDIICSVGDINSINQLIIAALTCHGLHEIIGCSTSSYCFYVLVFQRELSVFGSDLVSLLVHHLFQLLHHLPLSLRHTWWPQRGDDEGGERERRHR